MHHPGVETIGHGEGLEVAAQGHWERKLVYQVHGCAGHHGSAAQVLQAQHLGEKRSLAECLLSRTRPTTGHRATGAHPPCLQGVGAEHSPLPMCCIRQDTGTAHPAAFILNSVFSPNLRPLHHFSLQALERMASEVPSGLMTTVWG